MYVPSIRVFYAFNKVGVDERPNFTTTRRWESYTTTTKIRINDGPDEMENWQWPTIADGIRGKKREEEKKEKKNLYREAYK